LTMKDPNGNMGIESNIRLPDSGYRKFAMRHLPLSLFNRAGVEKLSGFTMRPSVFKNGTYKASSGFKVYKTGREEFLQDLNEYRSIHEGFDWSVIENNLDGNEVMDEAIQNNNHLKTTLDYANYLVENPENIGGEFGYFKMVKRRGLLGRMTQRGRENTTYALAMTSFDKNSLTMEAVITNPHTQLARLPMDVRKQIDSLGRESEYGKFNIVNLGKAMAIRTTIHAVRDVPSNVNSINTNAINERSKRIFSGMFHSQIESDTQSSDGNSLGSLTISLESRLNYRSRLRNSQYSN
ncbi:hypothetical protein ACR9GP_25945, partial [Enterobacter ludwigii]